jgi:hypothetical protein
MMHVLLQKRLPVSLPLMLAGAVLFSRSVAGQSAYTITPVTTNASTDA